MLNRTIKGLFLALMLMPLSAHAQFKDVEQIKQILDMTRGNWIAVRRWEGQDLLYFTHLESFRCGLQSIRYGINDDPAKYNYEFAPCDGSSADKGISGELLPYIQFPLNSVERITIELTYTTGDVVSEVFDRSAVEIP